MERRHENVRERKNRLLFHNTSEMAPPDLCRKFGNVSPSTHWDISSATCDNIRFVISKSTLIYRWVGWEKREKIQPKSFLWKNYNFKMNEIQVIVWWIENAWVFIKVSTYSIRFGPKCVTLYSSKSFLHHFLLDVFFIQ